MTRSCTSVPRASAHRSKFTKAALLAASAAVGLAGVHDARGADGTWIAGISFTWSNASQWVNNVIPGSNGGAAGTSTDTAFFQQPGGTDFETRVDLDRNIKAIVFDIPVANSGQTVGSSTGNSLYLTGDGTVQVTANTITTSAPAISAPVVLLGNVTFRDDALPPNGTAAGLKVNASITSAAAGPVTLTLDGVNYVPGSAFSSNCQWPAAITDGPNGAVSLVKNGSGVFDLRASSAAPNTYSGDTVLNTGAI